MWKTIKIVLIAIIGIAGLSIGFAYLFSPGSYPYAEKYQINKPEKDVIQLINAIKLENPKFIPPTHFLLADGRTDPSD